MKNTNNDGLLFLGRINEKDKNKPKPGSWSWVSCKNGYCLFAPPFTINGKEISPKKIKDASFTEELNKHIISHSKELPDFSWQLSEDNKVCINNKWKFVETILKFAKRKEKSVKTSKESRPKSKLDFMNQSRPGDWSWVQFFDGCCTFSPSHLIFGDKIIPQYINLPGSTKKINKYIGKHAKQGGSELPSFTYHINEHNEAVVDKIKVFSEIVSKF